jgi:Core-2/I-Branching enzyme
MKEGRKKVLMKICYLILAHKNPSQLHRLISRLNGEGVSFFVHINKREAAMYHDSVATLTEFSNVHFVKPQAIWWGTFSIVKAILVGMQQIVQSNVAYDRLVLLSGQDYPIKSNRYIQEFFTQAADKNYLGYFSLSSKNIWTDCEGIYNVKRRTGDFHLLYRSRIVRLPLNRKLPYSMATYGGSLWFNLTRECVEYIVGFVKNDRKYVNFMKHTFLPDEMFFQTLLLNSPLRSTIVNNDLRYIDWEKANPTPPATLMVEDFESLRQSSALYARKFDLDRDTEIFDLIDRTMLKVSASLAEMMVH